jgi:hypothetical protein
MYLTHFGRVRDTERLSLDMLSGVDYLAELGERHDGDENRTSNIQSELMDWLMSRARAHGVSCSDDDLREIFAGDVMLNSQGIEFWLDHGRD